MKIEEPEKSAAGLPAIIRTFNEIAEKTGLIRGFRLLRKLNQRGGIDCNACAWSDPDGDRTFAEFCESGVKAIADEAVRKKLDAEFFAKYDIDELAQKGDKWLQSQGRLTQPMILREGKKHYEPISWEEAIHIIAKELNSLDSPDEAVFYTSGRTSNEAAFLYQLFVRQFGTNNLPDCSNMCHESSSIALTESLGFGKATIRLEDLENADLIIIIGQNPGTNAPRMMSHLKRAKEKGAKIIAVNPILEAGLIGFVDPNPQHYKSLTEYALTVFQHKETKLADLYLQVRVGGDMAFLKGVMKSLLEREKKSPSPIFNYDFITKKTEGFQDFIANLERISWEDILSQSGLTKEEIEQVAEIYARSNRVVTCWAMGITQHKKAVETIQDIVNLHLLRGNIGKFGAGLCPVRGHSNVQGDRTMGVWSKIPKFYQALEKKFHFKVPRKEGYSTTEAIKAMYEGKVKVFFALGGNFLSAAPDTEYTKKALRNCNLTAQVITKLNQTAVVTGRKALILPCLSRVERDFTGGKEQFVSTESTMLNVQMSKGVLKPISTELRSEVWIIGKLARATLKNRSTVNWEAMINDYDLIRDAISRVVPGFENYNQRIRRKSKGFFLPNPPRQGIFPTDSGKAKFTASKLEKIEVEPGELLLTTIRAHDQFNTTIYTEDDRYRGISGSRNVIFMNRKDISDRGLKQGDLVDVVSWFDGKKRWVKRLTVVAYPIAKGCAAMYFPEANPLIPIESVAEKSLCPTSKLVKVRVFKSYHS